MIDRRPALAIDVGGTKIAVAVVDADGEVLEHEVVATPTAAADGGVWSAVEAMLAPFAAHDIAGVGIGSAGPIDTTTGTVSPLNIPEWRSFPIVDRVRALVGEVPVGLAGDGVAAALGEHWRGACRGVDDALVAVVSTGVGGGVVSRGRVVTGRTGNAGHLGHVVIDFDGEPCVCGGRGCVEMYASGPSMVRYALSQGWGQDAPDGEALFVAARLGDGIALAAIDRGAAALAAMIASQGAAFDLRHAVLGGGVLRSADVLLPRIEAHLEGFAALSFLDGFVVTAAELGGDAGLVGAARLIHQPESIDTATVRHRSS
jgi:glucokinase